MNRLQIIGLCTCVLALLASPRLVSAQEEVDREYPDVIRVYNDEGKALSIENVKITSATYEKVVYATRGSRGGTTEKDGVDVISISYGDAPRVYLDGIKAMSLDRYKKAISDFDGAKTAVEMKRAGEWLLEYAMVKKAHCLMALGRAGKDSSFCPKIVEALGTALSANEKSLLFNEIQLGLARCHAHEKKWADAKKATDALMAAAQSTKNAVWQGEAAREAARILIQEGRHAEAVNAFGGLIALAQRELRFAKGERRKKALADLEIVGAVEQGWARVAWAESSKSSAEWGAARSYFGSLGASYPDNGRVAAAVLNGMGRCLLESNPREALLKFTEAEVVYFTAKSEVARALYLKSEALKKLGGPRNRRLADQALKELREFYPESEWAGR